MAAVIQLELTPHTHADAHMHVAHARNVSEHGLNMQHAHADIYAPVSTQVPLPSRSTGWSGGDFGGELVRKGQNRQQL